MYSSVKLPRWSILLIGLALLTTIRLRGQTPEIFPQLRRSSNEVISVAFSPDGKRVISGNSDNTLKLWDIESGRELHTFFGHREWVHSVAFSPDGQRVLSGSYDKTLKLWDVNGGRELRTFTGHSGIVSSVTFSPDGQRALSGNKDGTLKLWDLDSGRVLHTFLGHAGTINSVAFSPDGQRALSGSWDQTLKLWDVESGRELRTFSGHTNWVQSVAFSPDGHRIVSGSGDDTLRLWKAEDSTELALCFASTKGEWVTVTPAGYYVSSAKGDKLLNVRLGNSVYSIEQWRSTLDHPDLVAATLRSGAGPKSTAKTPVVENGPSLQSPHPVLPPILRIESPADASIINDASTPLVLHVEDQQRAIEAVSVSVNGRRLSGDNATNPTISIPAGRKVLDLEVPVQLERGNNLVEVVASNGAAKAHRQLQLSTPLASPAERLPVLWLLAIGINQYDDRRWLQPLHYAAADAEAIVRFYEQQKGKLFSDVHALLIDDQAAVKPTRENILNNLSFLRQAGAHDVALLFVSAHGINDANGKFYLLPQDARFSEEGKPYRSNMISSVEVREVLDLPAKRLLLLDTCHAGGVKGGHAKAPDTNQLVRDLKGLEAVIFASSTGTEQSQEDPARGHGVFTAALLEGLEGRNGVYVSSGVVYMKDLDAYVSRRVPQITRGAQHPIVDAPEGYANFPVAVLP